MAASALFRNRMDTYTNELCIPTYSTAINVKDWEATSVENNIELMQALNNSGIHMQGYERSSFLTETDDIEDSSVSNPLDSLFLTRLSTLENENNKMKDELRKLRTRIVISEENIDDQWDYIYALEKQVSKLDQYGRRENVEIAGIPSNVSDKNLESEVLRILRQIGLKHLSHFHIVGCHRIGSRDKYGSRNTIVRFLNRKDAIQCLKLRKNLNLCRYIGYNNLRLMENLCPSYKSIFDDLNELKQEGVVKEVWTFNGIVNYRTTDDLSQKPIKVLHGNELEKLYSDAV